MRFDIGTLDSGERSLPFGLLVSCYVRIFSGRKIRNDKVFPGSFLLRSLTISFGIKAGRAFVWRKTMFLHHLLFQGSVSFLIRSANRTYLCDHLCTSYIYLIDKHKICTRDGKLYL